MKRIPHDEFGRKCCSRCHEYRTLDNFHKTKGRADGYADRCKLCRSRAKNPLESEFRREQHKKGLKKCATCQQWIPLTDFYFIKSVGRYDSYCKECNKEKAQEFRQKSNYNQRYYQANIQRENARSRKWQREHPANKLAWKQRRRAKIRGNGGSFTANEWLTIKQQHEHQCLCCGRSEPEIALEPDHIIPVSKEGTSFIDNIQPLCRSCNARKSDKIIDYRSTICES